MHRPCCRLLRPFVKLRAVREFERKELLFELLGRPTRDRGVTMRNVISFQGQTDFRDDSGHQVRASVNVATAWSSDLSEAKLPHCTFC